jgi:Na+/H+-dicarboxylate symporter
MVASIVSHIFSERIGMILLRTSGLVRASNTLSVIVFLVLGAYIIPKKAPSTRKTITDKVLEALTSPDVLNKIIPILSEKICETITVR